jgi:hypothetical protein
MNKKTILSLSLYACALVCTFFFFRSYLFILTSQTALTNDRIAILRGIITPIAFLSGMLYFLTFALAQKRMPLILVFVPILFLVSHSITRTSLLSALLIGVGTYIFYYSFFKSLSLLKDPELYKAFSMSANLTLAIVSLSLSLNVYQSYYAHIIKGSVKLNNQISRFLTSTVTSIQLESQAIHQNDTFESYATKIVRMQGKAATPDTVRLEEASLSAKLAISPKPTDSMIDILNAYTSKRVNVVIQIYRKQLGIAIPLAFYFITQLCSTTASFVASSLIWLTEKIIKRRRGRTASL